METEDAGGTAGTETQAGSNGAQESEAAKEPEEEKEAEKRAEEEIYYEYVNQVLVPEYGLADLQQEGAVAMDFSNPDSRMSEGNEWFEPKGIVSAYIEDLDLDGRKELFVVYWEKDAVEWEFGTCYELTGAVYRTEGGKVVYKDKMRLSSSGYDWEKRRESVGSFCIAMMEAEGRRYLVVYKDHLVHGVFSDGSVDQAMWMAEYKDGKTAVLQEARVSEITNNSGDVPYVGVTYGGGEEKEELLYAGWAQPEEGPYTTLEEAFTAFFQRKGLDVSEMAKNLDGIADETMGELTHTENAATVCTLNSTVQDVSNNGGESVAKMAFVGTDWTNLRMHIKEDVKE